MTLKTDRLRKNEASKLLSKWKARLNLSEWQIEILHVNSEAEDHKDDVGEGDTLARVFPDPVYLQAQIQLFPAFWKRTVREREAALVHELCHCITEELYNAVRASWRDEVVTRRDAGERLERLTQRIAYVALGRVAKTA